MIRVNFPLNQKIKQFGSFFILDMYVYRTNVNRFFKIQIPNLTDKSFFGSANIKETANKLQRTNLLTVYIFP